MSDLNKLTEAIIGPAIEVHQRLGPGLLETAYRKCLAYELRKRGLRLWKSNRSLWFMTKYIWNVDFEPTYW